MNNEYPPHIWRLAYSQAKLAQIAAARGKNEEVQEYIRKSIKAAQSWFAIDVCLITLLAQVMLSTSAGNPEQAVELTTFIAHHPASENETKQHARAILILLPATCSKKTLMLPRNEGRHLS